MTPSPEHASLRGDGAIVGSLLFLGLAYRVRATLVFPVVFDEVCVMAYGLLRAFRGARAFLFEAPVAVSNGITPLWLWAQAAPAALLGETTKAGLRTMPLLLGLLAVWLTFEEAGALGGRAAAVVGGFLAAIHGPYLFANARGEYSESLLVVLGLLLLRDLRRSEGGLPVTRAALWPALALLAYLGKGLVLWAAFAVYVALLASLRAWHGAPRREAARAVALVAAPLLPALAWLLLAEAVLFGAGRSVVTDLGPVESVFTNVRRLTFGYGTEAQPFMVGSARDALYVYTRFDLWPTLAALAVPALVVLFARARDLARALGGRDTTGAAAALRPLALVMVPLALLVAKGALDVRFHLLYWPVLLVYVAAGIAAVLAVVRRRIGRPRTLLLLAPVALFLAGSSLVLGPLDWGRRWAWEASPLASDEPRGVETFPNVDLQLVRCALARDSVGEARPLLLRALDRHPADRETVLEVGEALLRGDASDVRRGLVAIGELLRRNPGDAEARRLLEGAVGAASPP